MGHFLPFYHPYRPKNQNFKKLKKAPGDVIILHECTKNHDNMLYCSWGMVHDACIFHFGPFFALLPSKQPEKSKFQKTEKTPGDIIILHKCTKNHDHMLYCSLDIAHNRFNCYFSFWAIFYPFTSVTSQKLKISLLHLMRAIVHAHASTCATSLMHVKNSTHHLGLWHLLSGTLERRKLKKEQKHQIL